MANYKENDRIVIAQGTHFMVGRIHKILPELSAMQRAMYECMIGWDVDAKPRYVTVPEEMIVGKHNGEPV